MKGMHDQGLPVVKVRPSEKGNEGRGRRRSYREGRVQNNSKVTPKEEERGREVAKKDREVEGVGHFSVPFSRRRNLYTMKTSSFDLFPLQVFVTFESDVSQARCLSHMSRGILDAPEEQHMYTNPDGKKMSSVFFFFSAVGVGSAYALFFGEKALEGRQRALGIFFEEPYEGASIS